MPGPPLVSPPLPEMSPRKLVVMLCRTVSVPLPRVILAAVPESDPTVWPPFSRSKVPPLTMSAVVEARLPPAPELQRAGVDGGGAGVAVGAAEAEQPGAGLGQAAGPGDLAVEGAWRRPGSP